MPYEKGHKYHAPRAKLLITKQLAADVRERVPGKIMVEWHLAIASGHDAKLAQDEEGDLYVNINERGATTSQDQRTASMEWLTDRGYGKAAQLIHIEHSDAPTSGVQLDQLSPAGLAAIRAALRLALSPARTEPDQQVAGPDTREPAESDAIDAEFTESDASTNNVKEHGPADELDATSAEHD